MSVKIEHMIYFAATTENFALLYLIISENAPDIFLGQMLFYFEKMPTTLNRHFVWENMR